MGTSIPILHDLFPDLPRPDGCTETTLCCDVVRGARGDCCLSSTVALARRCGDDGLKPIGDEGVSSFAVDLNPRWYPEAIISDFTTNSCSVSAFPGVLVVLLHESENRGPCASYLRSKGMGSFSAVVNVNIILSSTQFMTHNWCGVGPRHTHGTSPSRAVLKQLPYLSCRCGFRPSIFT